MSLIGENGPEVIDLPAATTVHPAGALLDEISTEFGFTELKSASWAAPTVISVDDMREFPRSVALAIRAEVVDAGYDIARVAAVEFRAGGLYSVTLLVADSSDEDDSFG